MAAPPLAKRSALVLGVERADGRTVAVALAEAGADVALVTVSEDTKATFAANSVANELWAIGRNALVLTSDGSAPAVRTAVAAATADLGPLSIAVCNVTAPLPRDVFAGLRSDPAIVVLVVDYALPADARGVLAWTRELAAGGLRANALVASRATAEAAGPALKEHHPPEPLDLARAIVYLASDASAAVEGALVVAAAEGAD